jgi:hypothetical protein
MNTESTPLPPITFGFVARKIFNAVRGSLTTRQAVTWVAAGTVTATAAGAALAFATASTAKGIDPSLAVLGSVFMSGGLLVLKDNFEKYKNEVNAFTVGTFSASLISAFALLATLPFVSRAPQPAMIQEIIKFEGDCFPVNYLGHDAKGLRFERPAGCKIAVPN